MIFKKGDGFIMMEKVFSIKFSDYKKYGCIRCGCLDHYANIYGGGSTLATCVECGACFVILDNNYEPNDGSGSTLIQHPLRDTPPSCRLIEFWSPKVVGKYLSGFVMARQSGEKIVQIVGEIIGGTPKTSHEYDPNDAFRMQVKIQKEDGFDIEKLSKLCTDDSINKERLVSCLVKHYISNENTCVCCGKSIPEGLQICPDCESNL